MVSSVKKEDILLNGLARRLVAERLLTQEVAEQIQQAARIASISFLAYAVKNKLLAAYDVACIASRDFGLPLLDLSAYDLSYVPNNILSQRLMRRHSVIPLFKRGTRLSIAISDPTDSRAIDELKFATGLNIYPVLVEENKLSIAIDAISNAGEELSIDDLGDVTLEELEISAQEDNLAEEITSSATDDAPIVRFVHKLLLDAIHQNASDVHFEPYEKQYRVRFRIDGILYEVATPPVSLANRLAARLKVMSRLDISEHRLPQDGRFKMNLSKNRAIDFRVSTCPTLHGEKVVMRILDPANTNLNIEDLGFEDFQKELFLKTISKPQGMALVTGPTGSGKTMTLYTALNILNVTEQNISTVEDPVEINLPGINQVHVNLKTGLDFSTALRAFLRQDPDILMVGEIRDLETAEIAIKAAQTGHFVLSTLHTNSAAQTLTRLLSMGVAPFNLATSLSLVIAQRLTRRLCPHCKIKDDVPAETLIKEGFAKTEVIEPSFIIYRAHHEGCTHCTHGYRGRIGIYELMPISEQIAQIIMTGTNALEIAAQARQHGMQTLRESGLKKVKSGLTSLEELNRVSKD